MKITFYVLLNDVASNIDIDTTSRAAENSAALLVFVCELIQTVLEKTDKQLIIIDDDMQRIQALDKMLWNFSKTAFIPHDVCLLDAENNPVASFDNQDKAVMVGESTAPVVIVNRIPLDFATIYDGVVLNLATQVAHIASAGGTVDAAVENNKAKETENDKLDIAISTNTNVTEPLLTNIDRLLEIIPADAENKEKGRKKYAHYKKQGHQITTHKINNQPR